MTELAHSRLGASSCSRWSACPGSVYLCATMPPRTSHYAAEGTAAHALAAHCLTFGYNAERFLGQFVLPTGGPGGAPGFSKKEAPGAYEVDEDMADAVQTYLDAVRKNCGPNDVLVIEKRFALPEYHSDFFGTNDACIYKPSEHALVIFDYKHGQGVPVEVERNMQLMYYALGAASVEDRPLATIELSLVQPRCPHKAGPVRSWSTTPLDLIDYSAEIIKVAKRTEVAGARHKTMDPQEWADAYLSAGDHCKFCDAAPVCPMLYKRALEIAGVEFGANSDEPILREPNTMTPDDLGRLLTHRNVLKTWVREVESYANEEAKAGRAPTGFKLVAGKKRRAFIDESTAIDLLKIYGLDEKDVFTEPELKSPAQIEKVVGRKNKDDIAYLIDSKPWGCLLVPESDPREPLSVGDASIDFAVEADS